MRAVASRTRSLGRYERICYRRFPGPGPGFALHMSPTVQRCCECELKKIGEPCFIWRCEALRRDAEQESGRTDSDELSCLFTLLAYGTQCLIQEPRRVVSAEFREPGLLAHRLHSRMDDVTRTTVPSSGIVCSTVSSYE
jgi:hypothetical protein